jgi:hypothetical protein
MGPIRNPRWEQKRTEGYVIVSSRWLSPVSFINKTDRHDITEILMKVALNTINLNLKIEIYLKTVCPF